ncbi:MAG: tetratricopeptide repeat protein [Pseudomonadota bacterium]
MTRFSAVPMWLGWLLAVCSITLVTIASYWEAPKNVFHFDDRFSIVEHPPIHITEPSLANLLQAGANAYHAPRPLPSVTFAFDWWRGGGDPRAFQITNILIHLINAVLVLALLYQVLIRLAPGWRGAALAVATVGALVWAAHPIQVQAVTYIVQRMASLAALFMLLAVLLYVLGRSAQSLLSRVLFFAGCAVSFALGALSKENAWITPLLILLAEYGLVRHGQALIRSTADKFIIGVPLALGALALLSIVLEIGPVYDFVSQGYEQRDFTLWQRVLTQPSVIAFYLSQVLWPLPGRFSLEHDFVISTALFQPISAAFAWLGLLGWIAGGLWLLSRRAGRLYGVLLLWVPLTLVVESSFISLEMVFEHRMYVPLLGVTGLLGCGLLWLSGRFRYGGLAVAAIAAVIIVGLVIATQQRVPVWSSVLSLVQNSAEHAPNSARAWSNLARQYVNLNRQDLALEPAQRALRLDPNNSAALETMGIILTNRGTVAEAERYFLAAFQAGKTTHSWPANFGVLYLRKGDEGIDPSASYRQAVTLFRQAKAMAPWSAEYSRNLAIALARSGQCNAAYAEWQQFFTLAKSPALIAQGRQLMGVDFQRSDGTCARR